MDNQYIIDLIKDGLYVFPIRGRGKTVDEAKRPLRVKEGNQLITWKNPEILSYSEELAKKGHTAWAIWLKKSYRFGVDIDIYKYNRNIGGQIINKLKEIEVFYTEISGRGGIHIILTVDDNKEDYKLLSNTKWIEWKYDGYFIIHPTILKTPEGEYRYRRITGDIIRTGSVQLFNSYIEYIFPENVEAEIITSISYKYNNIGNIRIEGLRIEGLDELSNDQITALLYLLFNMGNCSGMEKIMEYIGEHGIVPVRKEMYNLMENPRTTRWLIQYIISSIMGYLGFSERRTYEYLVSFKFVDEDVDPRKDSIHNSLYNVFRRGNLFLLPRGGCPVCSLILKKESCTDTPMIKILRIPRQRIIQILEFVKRHVR